MIKILSSNTNSKLIFLMIVLTHFLLISLLFFQLQPIHFNPHNLFFLDLIKTNLVIPSLFFLILELGNLILIWLISSRILKGLTVLLPALIYSISFWSSYLLIADSFYIYLLFLILLFSYGCLLIKEGFKSGLWLAMVALVIASYSSFFLFLILPVALIILVSFKIISLSSLKKALTIYIVLVIPLIYFSIANLNGLINIKNNNVQLFNDPGLMNAINSYKGESTRSGFAILSKVSESKYVNIPKYLFIKSLKNLTPATYFSSQEKLLGFSFTPPLYWGFVIPFFFGLYKVLGSQQIRNVLLISLLLIIPSVLSKQIVDLNRLVLFEPIIIFIIVAGLINLYQKNSKIKKYLFYFCIFMIIFQFVTIISDISLKESHRQELIYGQSLELGDQ